MRPEEMLPGAPPEPPPLKDPKDERSVERTTDNPNIVASDLSDDEKNALKMLDDISMREGVVARRRTFRRMMKAEEFWKGNHYPVWSEQNFNWRWPFEFAANQLEDEGPTYQYVINLYQSLGLSAIAHLAQRVPKVQFLPERATKEVDVSTARGSTDIAELIEENNNMKEISTREAYLLWTQGVFGTYIRFRRSRKYGTVQEPQVTSQKQEIAPAGFECSACGYRMSMDEAQAPDGGEPLCPQCMAPIDPVNDAREAEVAEVPVMSGYREIFGGQEVMTVYGGVNLHMNPDVNEFEDCGYLTLDEEAPMAAIRATYGRDVTKHATNMASANPTDTFERNERLALINTSNSTSSEASGAGGGASTSVGMASYRRTWFRPWYFYALDDYDMAVKLEKRFPLGCVVAYANREFLEAHEEDVDDHWEICMPMPGQGMYREALGNSLIPLNEQIDDSANMIAEHTDFAGAPPQYVDSHFINMGAHKNMRQRPGTLVPVTRQKGGYNHRLSDLFYQPSTKLDRGVYDHLPQLIEMAQLVSGVVPPLLGGALKGNETAAGYRMARDASMGKLILFWEAVKTHHARVMLKGVKLFKKNRTSDVELSIISESKEYAAKYIKIDEIQGNVIAKPQVDEDFPATWAEMRENFASMVQASPELAQQVINNPMNIQFVKRYLANPEIHFPVEASRSKQLIELDELLTSAPIVNIAMDPDTGQPVEQYMPTIPVDVLTDDHLTHMAAIDEWANDHEGMAAKKMNPAGYANVMAHYLGHIEGQEIKSARLTRMLMAGQPPAPAEGEGGGGGEKPSV